MIVEETIEIYAPTLLIEKKTVSAKPRKLKDEWTIDSEGIVIRDFNPIRRSKNDR